MLAGLNLTPRIDGDTACVFASPGKAISRGDVHQTTVHHRAPVRLVVEKYPPDRRGGWGSQPRSWADNIANLLCNTAQMTELASRSFVGISPSRWPTFNFTISFIIAHCVSKTVEVMKYRHINNSHKHMNAQGFVWNPTVIWESQYC